MLNKVNETKNKVVFFFLFFCFLSPLDQPANMKHISRPQKTCSAGWNDHRPQNPGVADKGMLIDFVA